MAKGVRPEVRLVDEDEPFPDLEDEGEAIASELNDAARTDLRSYEPAEIGAEQNHDTLPLGVAGDAPLPRVVGRPTSPKIWKNAHLHPSVVQLRVWRRINGIPVLVGLIDKDATEEDFIRYFLDSMPKPGEGTGTFIVRPVDMSGQEVREETVLPPISEHHSELKRIRASMQAAAPVATGPDLSPVYGLQERLLMRLEENARTAQERAIAVQETNARERLELATHATRGVEALSDRMLRQEAQRGDQSIAMVTNVFTQMQMMQQTSAERERDAWERRQREDDAKRERERREYEDRIARERLETEQRLAREREEWTKRFEKERWESEERSKRDREDRETRTREQDGERQRQHEMRLKEMEISAQRDREHAERMMQLNMASTKSESVEGLLERGTKLLSMAGLQPGELLEKLFTKDGEEDNSGMWGELLSKALVQGIQTVGEVVKAQTVAKARAAGPPSYAPAPMMLPAPSPVSPGVAAQAPAVQPVQAQAPEPAQPAAEQQGPASTLPLDTQKRARKAIRDLVRQLRQHPEEQWQQDVLLALQGEFAIYHYCKDVSISGALKEAGADDTFIRSFLIHPAIAGIPDDVPRE